MNKLLAGFLLLFATASLHAATIVRYVNRASAGGNGTTNETSGANAAYTTLAVFEAAEDTDLTDAGGDIMQVYLTGASADTTAVIFTDWLTSNACYIELIGDWNAATDGTYSTSKYRLIVQNAYAIELYQNTVMCIKMRNLQIYNNDVNTDGIGAISFGIIQQSTVTISNCLLRGNNDADWYDRAINIDANTNMRAYIYNNVIYDWGGNIGADVCAIYANANAPSRTYCENNTLHNNFFGINAADTGVVAINNIVSDSGNANAYIGTFATGTDYNATDGTDNIGVGTHNQTSRTITWVNEAGDNFHIQAGDTGVQDWGTSTVFCGFTTDIDGETRSGSWDIGADEYASAEEPPATPSTETWKPHVTIFGGGE